MIYSAKSFDMILGFFKWSKLCSKILLSFAPLVRLALVLWGLSVNIWWSKQELCLIFMSIACNKISKLVLVIPQYLKSNFSSNNNFYTFFSHLFWCQTLNQHKIGLLLCHSHIELRLNWDWSSGWFEFEVEVRLNWGSGWDEVEMKFSWSWVEFELCWGWVELGLSWAGVKLS